MCYLCGTSNYTGRYGTGNAAMEQNIWTLDGVGTHAYLKSDRFLHTFPFARAGVALGPIPNVAALLKDKVLVSKVMGCAVTTEVRLLLPVGAGLIVLARDMLMLDEGGRDEVGVEVEGVTTVATGVVGGGGGTEVVAWATAVVETVDGDTVG